MSRRETVGRISVYEKPVKKVGGGRSSLPKKFTTRAEEFCDWMNALGYKIPRHAKAEHFDYIFQSEDTRRIARQLMKLVKPANALSNQEVNAFEKLKDDGRVLYGAELEAAFNRQKKLELEKAQKNEKIIARRKEMDKAIEEMTDDIVHLKSHDAVIEQQIEKCEEELATRESRNQLEKSLEERYDKVIQMKMDHIAHLNNVLQEKLKSVHSKFVSSVQHTKPTHLCDREWTKMLEDEERLNSQIKGMFEKYGADLMRQDLGIDDGLGLDTLQSELMYKTFKQHEKHLERLKHMIIFEKVRELELDIQMAAVKRVLRTMNSIVEDAKLFFQTDAMMQDRMLREVQQKSEALEKAFKFEKFALVESIKHEEANRRNSEVKGLVDQRAFAKKKQQEFISFLVNILVHQRVRMDVIRELLRAERLKNLQFSRTLQDYSNALISLAEREECVRKELQGPPSVDPELHELLQKYGIPVSVYHDPVTTYQAHQFIRTMREQEKLICEKRSELERTKILKRAFDRVDYVQTLARSLQATALVKNPVEETIAELENVHAGMEAELKFHERNKVHIAEESKTKKLQQLHEIQDMLVRHNNNSTKATTMNNHHASLF